MRAGPGTGQTRQQERWEEGCREGRNDHVAVDVALYDVFLVALHDAPSVAGMSATLLDTPCPEKIQAEKSGLCRFRSTRLKTQAKPRFLDRPLRIAILVCGRVVQWLHRRFLSRFEASSILVAPSREPENVARPAAHGKHRAVWVQRFSVARRFDGPEEEP